jgi:membrane protease YdiL (CAAX protease family)
MRRVVEMSRQSGANTKARNPLVEAVAAYVVFCCLSILSRFVAPLFLVVVLSGITFPLVWAKLTKDWSAIGFTRQKRGQALLWGLGAGLLLMVVIWLGSDRRQPGPLFWVQLAVAIPVWILIMSPFQEFFFRGWLQPRFQDALGLWPGLIVTSTSFALWHLCPAFEEAQIVPIASGSGMLFTTAMGMVYGYVFQRTRNIVAPWAAHVLAGLTLVLTGAMTFVQYVE